MPQLRLKNKLTQFLLTFTLLNVVLLLASGLPLWLVTDSDPQTLIGWIFSIAMYIGQIALFAMVGIFLLPYILLRCKLSRWAVLGVAIAVAAGLWILIIADAEIYHFFHWHFNSVILNFVVSGKVGEMGDLSWQETSIIIALVVVGFLLQMLLAYLLWRRITRQHNFYFRLPLFIFSLLAGALFISYIMYAVARAVDYRPIIKNAFLLPFYYTPSLNPELENMGILTAAQIAAHPIDLPFFIDDRGKKLAAPLHPLQYVAPAKKLNIVLIVVDTWRFDMMNQEVSPHMAAFAKRSLQFTRHYSGGNATAPGIFSLLYSLPYSYWHLAMEAKRPAPLLNALKAQQYQLGVYASAPMDMPEFSQAVFATLPEVRKTTRGYAPWQRDQQITHDAIAFLKQRAADKQPFFNFIFYDAVHAYSLPPNFSLRFTPTWQSVNRMSLNPSFDPIPFKNLYKNTVYFVDELIGDVLTTLQKEKLLENTVVIITADHGEEFNDNKLGYWGHSSNFTDYQLKVPFIVYWPQRKPQTLTHMTSHYDVVPTLLKEVVGVTNPYADYSVGHSLFYGGDKPFVIAGSYGYTAVIQAEKITNFIPGAGYRVTDKELHILPDNQYDYSVMQQANALLQKYYTNT